MWSRSMKGSSRRSVSPARMPLPQFRNMNGGSWRGQCISAFRMHPGRCAEAVPQGRGLYYDAVPTIEEQLSDRAKTSKMLEALTVYLDGMDEGDRHYDSCQQAREQLSEYVNGTFSLFNHRHDSGLRQAEREATPITPPGKWGSRRNRHRSKKYPRCRRDSREREAPQGQAAMPPVPHLPRKKERLEAAAPLFAGGVNYRITDDGLGAAPPSQRYANNVAAIRLLKRVEAENRLATAGGAGGLVLVCGLGRSGGLLRSQAQPV